MRHLLFTLLLCSLCATSYAQHTGNMNYQMRTSYASNNIDISTPLNEDIHVTVKGLANVKADVFVAIFSVSQVGNTTEEVNTLINERISTAVAKVQTKSNVEIFVDMVSFVPVYEYEVEKKIFSKKTYHEIPAGFELQKNIHIQYEDPNLLNEIISIFSASEIYDLVRVDYFSKDIEQTKRELMTKAKEVLKEKISNYEDILSMDLDSVEKYIQDSYKIVLPVEQYDSYQAYNSYSLVQKQRNNSNYTRADKATTVYYQPIVDKEFDFVMNPLILEPVIQVMYNMKLKINRPVASKPSETPKKQYYLITPSGEMKKIDID